MNQKALKKLEFDKIIHILAGHAASAGAKELCEHLLPSDSLPEIRRTQTETADALRRRNSTLWNSFSYLLWVNSKSKTNIQDAPSKTHIMWRI